jgi:hypothetical protein
VGENQRSGVVAGSILIVLGVGLFAINLIQGLGDAAVLFFIGGVFIVIYLYRRVYGFLIPGCILLGLGLGSLGQQTLLLNDFGGRGLGGLETLGLGVGFVAIYAIDRAYRGATHPWPLIPGGVLILIGLAQASSDLQHLVAVAWPLILVLVGLLIVTGAFGGTNRRQV